MNFIKTIIAFYIDKIFWAQVLMLKKIYKKEISVEWF